MNITNGTIIRTVLLILALTNQTLTILGKAPIPIDDEQITQLLSLIFTIGTSVWAWWKNNSFTVEAIKADEYLKSLRNKN